MSQEKYIGMVVHQATIPLTVDSKSTEQQANFLIGEDAVIMAPLEQIIHCLRQVSYKKVLRLRLVAERQCRFGDQALVVGESISLDILTPLKEGG
jgi:hypothetical protein